jgi:hypothetical protein
MHDPLRQLYSCRLFTLWHKDTESDGSDDACGFYLRARHGDPNILRRIIYSFERDFKDWFDDDGQPRLSTMAITLNMYNTASHEFYNYNWKKKTRFMKKHLYEILLFAENSIDSLHPSINSSKLRTRYIAPGKEQRAQEFANIIYADILRKSRPWYKHPRWHIHHWRLQVHHYQQLRRRLFTRCAKCHKPFINESPVTCQYENKKPGWFRSEENLFHMQCLKDQSEIFKNEKDNQSKSI